jgi:hypothetical protein
VRHQGYKTSARSQPSPDTEDEFEWQEKSSELHILADWTVLCESVAAQDVARYQDLRSVELAEYALSVSQSMPEGCISTIERA